MREDLDDLFLREESLPKGNSEACRFSIFYQTLKVVRVYRLFNEERGELFQLSCYHDCRVGIESAVMLDHQVSLALGRFLNRFDTRVGEVEILLLDVIIRASKRVEL